MTPEQERRVTAQQAALAMDIHQVQVWVDEHPTQAGGVWLDNTAAETGTGHVIIVLGLTAGATPPSSLLAGLEHPEHLRVVQVQYTEAQLSEVAEALTERRRPGISGVTTDVMHNRVRVYATTPDAEGLLREITSQYGPQVLDIHHGDVVVQGR